MTPADPRVSGIELDGLAEMLERFCRPTLSGESEAEVAVNPRELRVQLQGLPKVLHPFV